MNRTFALDGKVEREIIEKGRVECNPSISVHFILGSDDAIVLKTYLAKPNTAIHATDGSNKPYIFNDSTTVTTQSTPTTATTITTNAPATTPDRMVPVELVDPSVGYAECQAVKNNQQRSIILLQTIARAVTSVLNRTFALDGKVERAIIGKGRFECNPSISVHLILGSDDAVALTTYLAAPNTVIYATDGSNKFFRFSISTTTMAPRILVTT